MALIKSSSTNDSFLSSSVALCVAPGVAWSVDLRGLMLEREDVAILLNLFGNSLLDQPDCGVRLPPSSFDSDTVGSLFCVSVVILRAGVGLGRLLLGSCATLDGVRNTVPASSFSLRA